MPNGKARHQQSAGKRPFSCVRTAHNQLQERRAVVKRHIKQQMKKSGAIEDKTPHTWEWSYADREGMVRAFTKSEARSKIKKVIGIAKKRPLPDSVQIERIDFNEFTI
jgi:hypothetical protein